MVAGYGSDNGIVIRCQWLIDHSRRTKCNHIHTYTLHPRRVLEKWICLHLQRCNRRQRASQRMTRAKYIGVRMIVYHKLPQISMQSSIDELIVCCPESRM